MLAKATIFVHPTYRFILCEDAYAHDIDSLTLGKCFGGIQQRSTKPLATVRLEHDQVGYVGILVCFLVNLFRIIPDLNGRVADDLTTLLDDEKSASVCAADFHKVRDVWPRNCRTVGRLRVNFPLDVLQLNHACSKCFFIAGLVLSN